MGNCCGQPCTFLFFPFDRCIFLALDSVRCGGGGGGGADSQFENKLEIQQIELQGTKRCCLAAVFSEPNLRLLMHHNHF